jgi:hypothetical protein
MPSSSPSRSWSHSSRRSSASASLRPQICWALPWIIGLTIFSIFGGSYVGSYSSVFGIAIHHHLPFWWDIGAVAVFSLAVYYYAIHSRLGPERAAPQVREAIADAHQEELDLSVPEPA